MATASFASALDLPLIPLTLPHPAPSTPSAPFHHDTLTIFSPATNQPVYTLPVRNPDLITLSQRQASWSCTPLSDRVKLLNELYSTVLLHLPALSELLGVESARPPSQTRAEVHYAASYLRYFATSSHLSQLTSNLPPRYISLHPVGAVYAVTPFNLPLALLIRKLAPAFLCGCVVVAKVSERAPLTALALKALLEDAGFPGLLEVLVSDQPAQLTESVLAHDAVRLVSFTGSTPVGKQLMQLCTKRVQRFCMELGGNAPAIISNDACLEDAVEKIVINKMRSSGQTCIAVNRIFVHKSVEHPFVQLLAKKLQTLRWHLPDDSEEGHYGPLMHGHTPRVEQYVRESVAMGAKSVLNSHNPQENFFPATLLTAVTDDMPVFQEEVFGPVFSVSTYETDDELLQRANARGGLAAYVFTCDRDRATTIAQELNCGMVGVNETGISASDTPFGGWGESGIGREGGIGSVEHFLEKKFVLMPNSFLP